MPITFVGLMTEFLAGTIEASAASHTHEAVMISILLGKIMHCLPNISTILCNTTLPSQ